MLRDYPKILSFINSVEENVPVAAIRYKGFSIWPLIRMQIGADLQWDRTVSPAIVRARYNATVSGKTERNGETLCRLKELEIQRIARDSHLRQQLAAMSRCDALFLTVGFEFMALRQRICNIFYEPLKSLADENGVSWVEMIVAAQDGVIDGNRQLLLGGAIDISHQIACIQTSLEGEQIEKFPLLLDFLDQFSEVPSLDYPDLLLRLESILEYSRMFQVIIDHVTPGLATLVCYYNDIGMGFLHACSRKQVTSVEFQHCVINPHDWGWANWTAVPDQGYTLLPDHFWAWGETYAAISRRWQRNEGTSLTPIVGGNLWIPYWRTLDEYADIPWPHSDDPLGRTILYTAPFDDLNHFDGLFPRMLIEAVNNSPENYRWIIRFHDKTDRGLFDRIVATFAGQVPEWTRVWFHVSSECQLYGLFQHIDVLISQTSTTSIEAEAFGIPNIIIGEHGRRWYSEEIAHRFYRFATSTDELLAGIAAKSSPSKRDCPVIVTDREVARSTLLKLLGKRRWNSVDC